MQKVIISGQFVEFYEYKTNSSAFQVGRPQPAKWRGIDVSESSYRPRGRYSGSRSRRILVRKVHEAHENTHRRTSLVTLTLNPEYATLDRKAVQSYFRDFIRTVRRKFPSIKHYVGVPERHKSGKWHIHVLLFGYQPFLAERRSRALAMVWGKGFVDCRRVRPTDFRALTYVAKYVGKDLDEVIAGDRLFWASQLPSGFEWKSESLQWLLDQLNWRIVYESVRVVRLDLYYQKYGYKSLC